MGILYGVGVGPGDPELLTLKALNCIKNSDTIILPSTQLENCYAYNIVKQIYPEIDKKELIGMEFPMVKDRELLERKYEENYQKIKKLLDENKTISFLTIGDPTIYSTYMYIHKKLINAGANAKLINGIPSFCAVAATLNISLGENKDEIHIIPSSYDICEAMDLKGTKIFMKSGKQLVKLKRLLEETIANSDKKLDVYAVSNCGMENERKYIGVQALPEESGYLTIVVVK